MALTGTQGNDISKRAQRLGRIVDRLSDGKYVCTLIKDGASLKVQIAEVVRDVQISDENVTRADEESLADNL